MFNRRDPIAIALGVIIVAPPAYAQDKSIVVASTTSTQDSGLFEYAHTTTWQLIGTASTKSRIQK
jgi:ABC-type tungstate transport system permease subunit